jgi:hypothetical protein
MPSDMMRDVMPQEVTPACGQRGSRHLTDIKAAQPRTLSLIELVTAVICRAVGQTVISRGVCESALKLRL